MCTIIFTFIVEKLEKEGKVNIKQEIKAKVTAQQLE